MPTSNHDETLRIALHEGARHDLGPLFELAGDRTEAIRDYIDQGVVHLATKGGTTVGYSQIVPAEDGVYELRSLGVLPTHRRRGLGTRLVARSAAWVRDRGGKRLVAGTASARLDVLGFYQRLGFRVLRVERDAFGSGTGGSDRPVAHGIAVRDRIWLEIDL